MELANINHNTTPVVFAPYIPGPVTYMPGGGLHIAPYPEKPLPNIYEIDLDVGTVIERSQMPKDPLITRIKFKPEIWIICRGPFCCSSVKLFDRDVAWTKADLFFKKKLGILSYRFQNSSVSSSGGYLESVKEEPDYRMVYTCKLDPENKKYIVTRVQKMNEL